MKTIQIESFKVIGIRVRTTNENMKAATDIPKLWEQFTTDNVLSKIPNKIEDAVYSIYTNYETDHTGNYDTILACKVTSLEEIPKGMIGIEIPKSNYTKFSTKGSLNDNIVYNKWLEIWNTKLDREYIADFEVYGAKAMNSKEVEIEIYVSTK